MKIIYFIASFGDFNKLPLGGGQTAARRLLATLQRIGYKVVVIHRHPPTAQKRVIRGFQFLLWMVFDIVFVFCKLMFKNRKQSVTLYMGYMGKVLVPLEWTMSCITRLLGYKNVMYLAGGGTEKSYSNGNAVQKLLERGIVNNYKLVLTEGYENLAFVSSISSTRTAYLPNFTEEGFAPSTCPLKPKDRWNFIYFGRICKEKNVLFTIDLFNHICDKYVNSHLSIIGGGPEDYCKNVEEKIQSSQNKDKITRIGRTSHDDLKKIMDSQHFFIFPSNEPREGHSNALNEAMSYGIVPIVSDNNFLPSIVENMQLVVREMTLEKYSKVIYDIIESGSYDDISQEMYDRIQNNFTQTVVGKKLNEIIDTL